MITQTHQHQSHVFQDTLRTISIKIGHALMNKQAWILLGISGWIQKYLFADWEYLTFLMILIALDVMSGLMKAIVLKMTVSSRDLRQSIGKVIGYFILLIATHVIVNFTIKGQNSNHFAWMTEWVFRFLILVEVVSIYENLVAAFPRLDFMRSVIARLRQAMDHAEKRNKKSDT